MERGTVCSLWVLRKKVCVSHRDIHPPVFLLCLLLFIQLWVTVPLAPHKGLLDPVYCDYWVTANPRFLLVPWSTDTMNSVMFPDLTRRNYYLIFSDALSYSRALERPVWKREYRKDIMFTPAIIERKMSRGRAGVELMGCVFYFSN